MNNKKTITFNGQELEVSKIKIKNIGALAGTLKDLPKLFTDVFINNEGEQQELTTQQMLELAPSLIMQAGETLPPFLSVASGIDLETIENGGLDDLVVLIDAVLELNNFELIVGYIKNFTTTQTAQ